MIDMEYVGFEVPVSDMLPGRVARRAQSALGVEYASIVGESNPIFGSKRTVCLLVYVRVII